MQIAAKQTELSSSTGILHLKPNRQQSNLDDSAIQSQAEMYCTILQSLSDFLGASRVSCRISCFFVCLHIFSAKKMYIDRSNYVKNDGRRLVFFNLLLRQHETWLF